MTQQAISIWEVGNLVMPPDAEVNSELCRQALKQSQQHLKQQFDQGVPVPELVYQRAAFVDEICSKSGSSILMIIPVSLIAVGGYGRGELHPTPMWICSSCWMNQYRLNHRRHSPTF